MTLKIYEKCKNIRKPAIAQGIYYITFFKLLKENYFSLNNLSFIVWTNFLRFIAIVFTLLRVEANTRFRVLTSSYISFLSPTDSRRLLIFSAILSSDCAKDTCRFTHKHNAPIASKEHAKSIYLPVFETAGGL